MKVRIYTDGACSGNPGPGGWASVILFPNDIQEIKGYEYDTTNNRMELRAVIEALKVSTHVLPNGKFDVYTDSAYITNAINLGYLKKWKFNGWKTVQDTPVKNQDLWIKLDKLMKYHHINLIKVKGHSDNEYNNRCDKMARNEVKKIKV